MKLTEIRRILKKHRKELHKRFQVKDIGIFGSYVRKEQRKRSDLDILVEFEENAHLSLLDFACLQNHLSDLLSIKVDLVEKKCLKPYIGRRILQEVDYL